ncbi:NADPH-dependent FMN reductase [Coraliomargarita parva]|uniref:NADPH-dependent FMN reductase n=1 Tax=Coraliomargarita parva TaxID=3014050 RepID=UPI0022B4CC1D|nr:NADPH-dependent FMN reductase [Coraliomargarita parva]
MITLLVGTNRPEANSRKIAHTLESIYRELDVPVRVLDLIDLPPAIFQPSAYAEKPDAFKPFAEAVLQAQGLHVLVPEYNGGFPGVLKYFIDMLPFPESFERRPVAFTGVAAGQFGALRPVEQLQQIFAYRNAYLYPNRVFIMGVHKVLDDAGKVADPELLQRLKKQAAGFVEFLNR